MRISNFAFNSIRLGHSSGFLLAPLLYLLALGGIGAAVMFSGYSQVLRSGAEVAAVNTVRAQLMSAGQTLSASSLLDSPTSTVLLPPAVTSFAAVTDTARLPASYGDAATTGTPTTAGVINIASGVRQLDPWGKYYVYCRWENAVAAPAEPSIMIISGGPDSQLSTKCGDTNAQGDDRLNRLTVAEAVNRANVWQVVPSTNQVKYGLAADAVKVNDDGSLSAASLTLTQTPLAIASGGTGASTAAAARTSLAVPGSTGIGASGLWDIDISGLAASSTVLATPRDFAVGGTTGLAAAAVSFDGSADVSLTLTGTLALASGGTGATTAADARTNLGATVVGAALFTAADAIAARSTLGATALGTTLFTAADAAAARTALGASVLGTALFTAADAGATRATLGLGTMATQDANAVAITGGTITGVNFSGGSVSSGSITGVIDIAHGGTGQTTAAAARTAHRYRRCSQSDDRHGQRGTPRLRHCRCDHLSAR